MNMSLNETETKEAKVMNENENEHGNGNENRWMRIKGWWGVADRRWCNAEQEQSMPMQCQRWVGGAQRVSEGRQRRAWERNRQRSAAPCRSVRGGPRQHKDKAVRAGGGGYGCGVCGCDGQQAGAQRADKGHPSSLLKCVLDSDAARLVPAAQPVRAQRRGRREACVARRARMRPGRRGCAAVARAV